MLAAVIVCHLVAAVYAGYEVPTITCVCSTTHCIEHQMFRCNTTGMCFSQYLDRRDGSHPVVRGCISSKTPLLCENRRPAIAGGSWPALLCCDSNLCNRDAVPTPLPPSQERSSKEEDPKSANALDLKNSSLGGSTTPDTSDALDSRSTQRNSRASSFPKIVSPIYISVLVLGVISLVVIGIVAAIVLRRNNKFYADQYGALERIEEYSKPAVDVEALACHHASHSHHHYVYREKDYPKT